MSNIFKLDDFVLLTFASTHMAMAAEQHLQQQGLELLVMPVPREISSGCGLAIKLYPKDADQAKNFLREKSISHVTIYKVTTSDGTKHYKLIDEL